MRRIIYVNDINIAPFLVASTAICGLMKILKTAYINAQKAR